MIRVVYRWKVNPGYESTFAEAWARGTKIIRATVKGARGSLLLQNQKNPSAFTAIARWASFDDWRAFRRGAPPDPEAFRIASAVSELQSVEAFREVRDLRVLQASEAGGQMVVSLSLATRRLKASSRVPRQGGK